MFDIAAVGLGAAGVSLIKQLQVKTLVCHIKVLWSPHAHICINCGLV